MHQTAGTRIEGRKKTNGMRMALRVYVFSAGSGDLQLLSSLYPAGLTRGKGEAIMRIVCLRSEIKVKEETKGSLKFMRSIVSTPVSVDFEAVQNVRIISAAAVQC